MLAEDDADEVLDDEGDVAMDSDNEGGEGDDREEIILHNDSIAYFDQHKDSVFAIAQHPVYPRIIATGGSEGDADDAPGKGYVIDTSAAESRPVLPPSYASDPSSATPKSTELNAIFTIDGHSDSINALAFSAQGRLPRQRWHGRQTARLCNQDHKLGRCVQVPGRVAGDGGDQLAGAMPRSRVPEHDSARCL